MADPTRQDIELLVDLRSASAEEGLRPCLIGAGAIRFGPGEEWDEPPRMTSDWDFAVRVASWEQFESLAQALTKEGGGFRRTSVPQLFLHHAGGKLDVVPYGGIEEPDGTIRWADGTQMEARSLRAVEVGRRTLELSGVELDIATVPALVGLKLLAYLDRRPGIVRDIGDVHRLLFESDLADDRVDGRALDRLEREEVSIVDLGAYLVGRDVRSLFEDASIRSMIALLEEAEMEGASVVPDAMRTEDSFGLTRERILGRFTALRFGMLDR